MFVVKASAGDVRVAATGTSQNGVMRIPSIATTLKANWSALAFDNIKISAQRLMNDLQGSLDYRVNLIKVQTDHALQQHAQ